MPDIRFTAEGYAGTAEAYYAVTAGGTAAPGYAAYTAIPGSPLAPGSYQKQITLPLANGNYDVYVLLFKDGKASAPVRINTASGGAEGDWIWGGVPYKSYYVASDGDDAALGTKEAPLSTVEKALEKIAAVYAPVWPDPVWPNKGGDDEPGAGIIILDEVAVTETITIDGTIGYPPIVLIDDPETGGGKLQAAASIQKTGRAGSKKNLLYLDNGARVTLGGGLILRGTGVAADDIRAVYVYNSAFTMNGGEISGYSFGGNSSTWGGGIYAKNSALAMSGEKYQTTLPLYWSGIHGRQYVYHERRGNLK